MLHCISGGPRDIVSHVASHVSSGISCVVLRGFGSQDPVLEIMAAKGVAVEAVLTSLRAFHGQHGNWPRRKDVHAGGDALARKAAAAAKAWADISPSQQEKLRRDFTVEIQWLLRETPLGAGGQDPGPRLGAGGYDPASSASGSVRAVLSSLQEFFGKHGSWPSRRDKRPGGDTLARKAAGVQKLWAQVTEEDRVDLRAMFSDAVGWLLREDRSNAVIATLREGIAFRTEHGRHACRGRASWTPHEDALAQRVARAVLAAQQQEALRSQFGAFLDSWMNADAARDAALEAAQSALQEGMAFRLQHDRLPRRGREAELEGEDALAQRIARAVPLAQQQEELRSQFGDFLDAWMNADAARDAALEAAQSALQEGIWLSVCSTIVFLAGVVKLNSRVKTL